MILDFAHISYIELYLAIPLNIGNFLQRSPVILNNRNNNPPINAAPQPIAAARVPRPLVMPPPRNLQLDEEDEGSKCLKECKHLSII